MVELDKVSNGEKGAFNSKGTEIMAVIWVETVVCLGAVSLRWYTRKFVSGRVGPDDYILMASCVRPLRSNP